MFSFVQAMMTFVIIASIFPNLGASELTLVFTDNQSRVLNGVETRLVAHSESDDGHDGQYRKSNRSGVVVFQSVDPGQYVFQAQKKGFVPLRLTLDLSEDTKLTRVLLKVAQFEKLEKEAQALREEGRPEEATELLNNLLQSYPEDALLHNRLALCYADLADAEKALAEAELAAGYDLQFASSPDQVRGILLRASGKEALQNRDFPTAIAKFEALTQADEADPTGYHGLALAYGHTGRYKEALEAIERAIELDPNDEGLKTIRTILRANSGQ